MFYKEAMMSSTSDMLKKLKSSTKDAQKTVKDIDIVESEPEFDSPENKMEQFLDLCLNQEIKKKHTPQG